MSVEVRQMIVKTNVLQRNESHVGTGGEETGAKDSGRQAILEECQKMIVETLRELKER